MLAKCFLHVRRQNNGSGKRTEGDHVRDRTEHGAQSPRRRRERFGSEEVASADEEEGDRDAVREFEQDDTRGQNGLERRVRALIWREIFRQRTEAELNEVSETQAALTK